MRQGLLLRRSPEENSTHDSPFPTFLCHNTHMTKLLPILCLTFAVLLFAATEGLALPACPDDQDERYVLRIMQDEGSPYQINI